MLRKKITTTKSNKQQHPRSPGQQFPPAPQFPRLIFLSRTRFAPLAVGFTAKEALKTKLFSVTVLNKFTCAIPILSGTFQRSVSSRELNGQFYDS